GPLPPAAGPGGPRVLHVPGHVYRSMNTDALARVAAALERCRHDVGRHCYAPASAATLAAAGIGGARVRVRFGSRAEVMADQAGVDVLFLPLAFLSYITVRVTPFVNLHHLYDMHSAH